MVAASSAYSTAFCATAHTVDFATAKAFVLGDTSFRDASNIGDGGDSEERGGAVFVVVVGQVGCNFAASATKSFSDPRYHKERHRGASGCAISFVAGPRAIF